MTTVAARWVSGPLARIGNVYLQFRRYPVIPIFLLLTILVLPAALADIISPHDPIKNDLKFREQPPGWAGGGRFFTKTVVERGQEKDHNTQIAIDKAQRLNPGRGIGQVPGLNTDLLFSTGSGVHDQLDQEVVPPALVQEFAANGVNLSGDTEVAVQSKGRRWVLNDQSQQTRHTIRVQEGVTNVYQGGFLVGDEIQIVRSVESDWQYPFGRDQLGRGILTRMIHGARVSLIISLAVISISGVIGTLLGMIAGYYGGAVDYVISRLIDIAMALPPILVALVLVIVVGQGMGVLIAIIVGFLWSQYARLVRGETLSIVQQDYVARARVAGSPGWRIMARHVLPNVFNSLIIIATLQIGYVIIIESSLSFLGLGIPPPTPSWGSIVADGKDLIIKTGWWVSLFPGLAIALTVLSVNLLGDWLRDKLDPKLRQV